MHFSVSACVLLTALSWSACAAAQPGAAAERVVARITSHYRLARTFRARFRQVFVARATHVNRRWSGRVAADRSGKFSFVYDQPVGRRVVCDGRTVETYDPTTRQLYRARLRRSQLRHVLVFLEKPADLRRRFRFRVMRTTKERAKAGLVLEAVPRKPVADYDRLLLYVERRSGTVRRVLVVDAAGNVNRFTLSHVELGAKLASRSFGLRRPAGAHLVRP